MDNLDITPAFVDIFARINKHLDLLPFQKLLNDQNSTLTDVEKEEMKNRINESSKKVRQLNLVLDELKDQLVDELEKVQNDYEGKNCELYALEEHLNYVRLNQFNQNRTSVLKAPKSQDRFDHDLEYDLDDVDQMKKENMNRFMNQKQESAVPNSAQNLPKKSLKKPASQLKQPNSQFARTNGYSSIKCSSMIKKPACSDDRQSNQQGNNQQSNPQFRNQLNKQPPKKERNVDNIYINFPQINYISLSEFNYIPKYMRGRLSFETCNKLVDEFNKAIETKYKFMMIPTTKYTSDQLIKYTLYKSQEDDETRGLFFVTPKDLHDFSELKISMNNTKIFVQCVRHCKRIKEIRGIEKLIRYVVLNW